MNYEKAYRNIVDFRLKNAPSGIVERHHIVPKALGGGDDEGNIVSLTPREHFVCHHLLAKMHGGSMWSAYYFMAHPNTNSGKGVRVGPRQYEAARNSYVQYLSTKVGEKNPNFGNTYSDEARKKISETRRRYLKDLHGRAKTEGFRWIHRTGEEFFGNHFDLSKKTGLDSSSLRRVSSGQMFSYKGWECPSSGRVNMRAGDNTNTADKNIYTWISPEGEKFTGTRSFARDSFGLNYNGTSNLVRGVIKKHKGWSVDVNS